MWEEGKETYGMAWLAGHPLPPWMMRPFTTIPPPIPEPNATCEGNHGRELIITIFCLPLPAPTQHSAAQAALASFSRTAKMRESSNPYVDARLLLDHLGERNMIPSREVGRLNNNAIL